MALPRLNENPEYELNIPSTGQTLKYRPFLVKEQKVLLIAYESQDAKQVLSSIMNCINACSNGVDVKSLSTFDVDYIFTQIRSKSVGEVTSVSSKCSSCEEEMTIDINLNDLKIEGEVKKDPVIDITDAIKIRMKYPSYTDFINDPYIFSDDKSNTEKIFSTLILSIDSVMTEEENIKLRDEPREEIEEFINSLTTEQFEKISVFVESFPKTKYEQDHKCLKCNHKNKIELEGLQDFFS